MQRQSGNRGRARARAAIPLLVLAAAGIGSGLALGSDRDARDLTVTGPGGSTTIVTTPPFSTTVPGPSIASTLIAAPSTVVVGAPITLTIGVEDANVATPSVTEYVKGLDQNFTVQSATSTQGACTTSGAQLECPLTNLAPGGQVGATVVAVPTTVGTFQLSAVATPYGPASPSVSVTDLAATADLGVSLPTSTLGPRVGHTVRIGVTVANVGPLAATGAVLRIAVPPETRLLAAVATAGSCSGTPRACQLGSLGVDGRDLVVVTLLATRPGTGRLVATVSGRVADPVQTNNASSETIAVPKPPAAKGRAGRRSPAPA